MSTIAKAADGLWSVLCLMVGAVLIGLGLYWAVLQRPFLEVNTASVQKEYRVTAGSLLYIENPIIPADFAGKVDYANTLVIDQFTRYSLPSPEMARQEIAETNATKVVPVTKPAAPLYAVFIPSYVRPGTYKYVATATYRLNPFRTATVDLPQLTIVVE